MKILRIIIWVLLSLMQLKSSAQQKMDWFADAKLGIFIHWGIYSVNGISESWSFYNNYISYADYKEQLNGFSASNYNPQQWVEVIKESGAKYAVITSKHHDGISLWDTRAPQGLSIPKNALAKKDVLSPFVAALKASGLKTGIYYSLPDWSKIPGIVYINLPNDRLDKDFTIVNILLDKEIDLYSEEVGALTTNN